MTPPSIILVGPMGAGKSTIGRLLAAKFGYSFLDSDHVIEEKTGADISWIFDVEGEAGFREREAQVLASLMPMQKTVIATGGGIVIREDNRERLQKHPMVIYLQASIEQLVARTAKDKKRPLLQVENPREKILALVEEREPYYRAVATYTIKTDGHSPKSTVNSIYHLLTN